MPVSSFRLCGLALSAAFLCAPAWAEEQVPMQSFRAVTNDVLLNPSPADWLMWRRTYDSWGHSPLDQINTKNINRLQLAWAYIQEPGNQEAAPLVNNGIMYLAQSQNVVHALDATNGNLIWEYRHPLPS